MKDITPYLKYYIGSRYQWVVAAPEHLVGKVMYSLDNEVHFISEAMIHRCSKYKGEMTMRPILRRLSSITQEEAVELVNIIWDPVNKQKIYPVFRHGELWSFEAWYFFGITPRLPCI